MCAMPKVFKNYKDNQSIIDLFYTLEFVQNLLINAIPLGTSVYQNNQELGANVF